MYDVNKAEPIYYRRASARQSSSATVAETARAPYDLSSRLVRHHRLALVARRRRRPAAAAAAGRFRERRKERDATGVWRGVALCRRYTLSPPGAAAARGRSSGQHPSTRPCVGGRGGGSVGRPAGRGHGFGAIVQPTRAPGRRDPAAPPIEFKDAIYSAGSRRRRARTYRQLLRPAAEADWCRLQRQRHPSSSPHAVCDGDDDGGGGGGGVSTG